jgi:Protein of unknown function (DUF664)
MAGSCLMIDDFAKEYLHDVLRDRREVMLWKLDGLSEYDIRRPLTATGTNLLGLVKHLTNTESRYLGGELFGRPLPQPLPAWDADGAWDNLWVTEHETREQIIDGYRLACEHSDSTINALAIDTPGHVPWWPRPDVKLFNIMVHVLTETTRHAGHADILREQLDGSTGTADYAKTQIDPVARETYRAKVEQAAKAAATRSDHASEQPDGPAPIEP